MRLTWDEFCVAFDGGFTCETFSDLLVADKEQTSLKIPVKLSLNFFADEMKIDHAKFYDVDYIKGYTEHDKFCLKPINGCTGRGVFLMNNGINLVDNKKYNREELINKYLNDSKKGIGYSSICYVEELLMNGDVIPDDWKIYMFYNTPEIAIRIKRFPHKEFWVYDISNNWKLMYSNVEHEAEYISEMNKKDLILTAIRITDKLKSKFLRVDMYVVNERGICLSEMVNIPGNPGKPDLFRRYNKYCDQYLGHLYKHYNNL